MSRDYNVNIKSKNIRNNIDFLDDPDAFYNIIIMLYASKDYPYFNTLHELVHVLGKDKFLMFLTFFQGQTIEVPLLEDAIGSLKMLLAFQYSEIDGMNIDKAVVKAGFESKDTVSVKKTIERYKKILLTHRLPLGGVISEADKLKYGKSLR